MLDEWRRLHRLRRELRDIDNLYEPQLRAAKSYEDWLPVRSVYDIDTGEILRQISAYEIRKLALRADKWGVEMPPFDSEDAWEKHSWTGHLSLRQPANAKVNGQINNAIFAYWEKWARLLIPILSLLVAIIALLAKSGCQPATH